MSSTAAKKESEILKKALAENDTQLKPKTSKSNMSTRSNGGAGENPAMRKPLSRKPGKTEEEKPKRISGTIADRVPKKNAQRAKGSTSLNKSMEQKPQKEATEKKRNAPEAAEKLITVKPDNDKATETPRIPRFKENRPKPKPVARKEEKTWVNTSLIEEKETSVMDKLSDVEEKSVVSEDSRDAASHEIQNAPFGSCSFFEKLQQGVKAYFSSRNSLTPNDKSKREGGPRTRGRVEKGVKEDALQRNPGFLIKNKINSWESDSYVDQLRSYSSLGGNSSNLPVAKPKIFQKLKHKKLYRPKKHYVRIQIPRKGYFYRSTVQFKAPGSQGPLLRLEPNVVPKNEPKAQVSRMASSSSESSHLPAKKRIIKRKKKPTQVERKSSKRTGLPSISDEKLHEFLTFNWPDRGLKRRKSLSSDVVSEFSNPGQGGETQMSAIFDKTENSSCEQILSCQKNMTELNSSYTALFNYLNSTLKREEIMYDLEITPVNDIKEDMYFRYADQPIEEPTKTYSDDSDALYVSPVSSAASNRLDNADSDCPTDEIDIHLELQNYLNAFDNLSVFRNKTKSHLQNSFAAEEFYEASDTKSGSSFESASSTVTQIDVDLRHALAEQKLETELEEDRENSPDLDFYEKIRPYEPEEDELDPPNSALVSQVSSSTWSPTLQDLIDIYNSVLKQNKKIRKNTRKSVTACLSSHLFKFLNNKLKEKKFKSELIKLSQDLTKNYRRTPRTTKQREDAASLQNYVSMFQELLQSSLTFSQIARLNNAISGLEDPSEKNCNKELSATPSKTLKEPEKVEPKTPVKGKKSNKSNNQMNNPVQKIELPSPTELELMLKSCFNSKGLMCTDPLLSDSRNKILVTVKLSGDRVLVSNLSYFKNEEALKQRKPKRKGTSELIIESVSKKQVKDVWYRKTKSSILRELSSKSQKQKPQPKKLQPKRKCPQVKQYKYDRMQLRSQHPIEAIAEGSESELSDQEVKEAINEKTMLPTTIVNSDLENVSVACNWRDETERNLPSVKSPKRRPALPLKKKPLVSNVRSMVDLKNKVSNQNFFCYSSTVPEKKMQDKQSKWSKSATKTNQCSKTVVPTPESTAAKPEELTKSSSDTVLYLNNGLMTECCSIELLFADNSERSSGFGGSTVTVSGSVEKELSEKSYPVESLEGKSRGESPILLHAGNAINVDHSFFSNAIHSDSFLKCFSGLQITKSEMNLLLKSNSKIKFYPGRVKEKKEDVSETSPFVTFVLTPSQNEKMGFSDSKVEIIEKTRFPVVTPDQSDEGRKTEQISDEKVHLDFVEEFIRELSKAGKKAKKTPEKKQGNSTKLEGGSSLKQQVAKNKNHISCFSTVENAKKKVCGRFDKTKLKKTEKVLSMPTKRSTGSVGKRKKLKTSPFSMDKVLNNVCKVIEDFKKEQNNGDIIPEDTIITLKNPLDAQIEFIESLKAAIMAAKNIRNKKEIIAIIEKVFENQQRKLSQVSGADSEKKKEVKALKIKIHCCSKDKEEEKSPVLVGESEREIRVEELELLDSLLFDEPGGGGLQRKGSVYFDALEETEEPHLVLPSGSHKNLSNQDSDETILTKITDSLEHNKFPSSKTLVEKYLKKTENSEKLRKLLMLVEDKSRSLMIEMERKAWLEVLALLEELVETVENRNSTSSLKTTKAFVDKIQLLNNDRLMDFKLFCDRFAQPNEKVNFFGKITKVLKQLKTKLVEGKGSPEYKIHSTVSLAHITEGRNDLKRKIQSQMTCIEELMRSEESIPREIREVKDKVGKKMKTLDEFLGGKRESYSLNAETTCSETEADDFSQEEEEDDEEEEKVKDFKYLNMLQSFLRIWDTRMSLLSFPKDI